MLFNWAKLTDVHPATFKVFDTTQSVTTTSVNSNQIVSISFTTTKPYVVKRSHDVFYVTCLVAVGIVSWLATLRVLYVVDRVTGGSIKTLNEVSIRTYGPSIFAERQAKNYS